MLLEGGCPPVVLWTPLTSSIDPSVNLLILSNSANLPWVLHVYPNSVKNPNPIIAIPSWSLKQTCNRYILEALFGIHMAMVENPQFIVDFPKKEAIYLQDVPRFFHRNLTSHLMVHQIWVTLFWGLPPKWLEFPRASRWEAATVQTPPPQDGAPQLCLLV